MYYDMKRSGERIRQLRIQNRHTQEALAKALNIDRSLLSHIESGKRGCSVDLFVRLSDFFGVSLDLLITGEEHTIPQRMHDKAILETSITELVERQEAFKEKL